MILADTNIWIDHLKHGNVTDFDRLLMEDKILLSDWVELELLCGTRLARERQFLREHLAGVKRLGERVEPGEAVQFLHENQLGGRGLSAVDILMLMEAERNNALLWTRDRKLREAAKRRKLDYEA